MIKKPAERLVDLLGAHRIDDHPCQICSNPHSMWANQLGGPKHYSKLYDMNLEERPDVRWQSWDLPNERGTGIIGRHRFLGKGRIRLKQLGEII